MGGGGGGVEYLRSYLFLCLLCLFRLLVSRKSRATKKCYNIDHVDEDGKDHLVSSPGGSNEWQITTLDTAIR